MISIDPGVEVGWALWDKKRWNKLVSPVRVGIIKPRISSGLEKFANWQVRVESTMRQFTAILEGTNQIEEAIIEYPQFFGSDATGQASARKGDLVKLAIACGMIGGTAYDRGIKIAWAAVKDWKGQLPKRIVENRIRELLGLGVTYKDHEWDAVGIGLWSKGFFV